MRQLWEDLCTTVLAQALHHDLFCILLALMYVNVDVNDLMLDSISQHKALWIWAMKSFSFSYGNDVSVDREERAEESHTCSCVGETQKVVNRKVLFRNAA